ncbi:hypothetical protein C2U70_27640 [Bradyrhizobium guangdongense]|nr:hypothetical protein C2U70_27640 [Bradyrhizobium guangdongense]
MAGLDPAIHDLLRFTKNVDARDKPGHDAVVGFAVTRKLRAARAAYRRRRLRPCRAWLRG